MTDEIRRMISEMEQDITDSLTGATLAKVLIQHIKNTHDRHELEGGMEYQQKRYFTMIEQCPKEQDRIRDQYTEAATECLDAFKELLELLNSLFGSFAEQIEEVKAIKRRMN